MDLSLRGSQINLAERYKPTVSNVKQSGNYNQRPVSATYTLNRRIKPEHKIKRPLSADERLARSLNNCIKFSENILNEGKLSKNKKYSSASSSSLLKFFLDEPIRRPWLCRGSPENNSKHLNFEKNNLKSLRNRAACELLKRKRTNLRKNSSSYEESNSSTEEINYQSSSADDKRNLEEDLHKSIPGIKITPVADSEFEEKMQSDSTPFSFSKNYKIPVTTSSVMQEQSSSNSNADLKISSQKLIPISKLKQSTGDFWHDTKPDLPGRVSFGKSGMYEVDMSDIENETPPEITTRSTESHFIPSTNVNTQSVPAIGSSSATKKNVHFGEKNGEVQAQTFEYPKCPSDNCSCSNRSSISTISAQEISEKEDPNNKCPKCTCNFSCNTLDYSGLSSHKSEDSVKNEDVVVTDTESSVIKEYKNVIKEVQNIGKEQKNLKIDKSEFKQSAETILDYHDFDKLEEELTFKSDFIYVDPKHRASTSSNEKFLKGYDTFFANNFEERDLNESRSDILSSEDNTKCEHLNNFSNTRFIKKYSSEMYEEQNGQPRSKIHLSKSLNNIHYSSSINGSNSNNRSESVITNYLKVAGTTQNTTAAPKKKVNNSSTSNNGNNNLRPQNSAPTKRSSKTVKNRRSKSASITSSENSNHTKIKKSGTYSCLREDSNLDEFQLDKVDSWMSMHSNQNSARTPQVSARNRRLQNYPKYSKASSHRGGGGGGGGGDNLGDTEEDIFDSNGSPDTSDTLKSDENSQDGSTYDEIVSVIKEIEEEKKKHDDYNSKKYMDHIHSKDVNFMKLQALLESEGINSHTESTQTSGNGSPQSADKLKDILEYLEDVENDCDRTLLETRRSIPETNRTEIEFSIEPDIAEDVPKLADLLMLPNHQLARRVIALSLRANELANAIQLSKQHIQHIRQEKQKGIRLEKQNTTKRVQDQKKHFEGIISRHQTFIEQLLKDKGALCEKVTALTRRIDSQNQAWEHKLETEVARAKETTLAGEKIRRERWVRENTKKIKELTVKGLEMEINRMQLNHQQEINEMKREHQQQLLDSLEEARLKYEQNLNAIRETLAQEREMLVEKERIAVRERFEKQMDEERKSFDEQKTKLIEGFAFERDQIQSEYRQKESDFLNKKQEILEDKDGEIQRVIAEFQEKLVQQEQKYQARINTIEKQFESDFIIWKREYENSCKLKEVENENTIRQHYRTERDRQIDAIVTRMDAESQKCQEEFELKLSRLKEKYDDDMREAENVEKSLRDKYNDTRSRLAESEAMTQNFQAEIKQLQMELDHSKKMNNDFLDEKEKVKENARNDVLTEIANIKSERDNEIQKIYKRVQQAIEKKDATVDLLQKDNGTLRERCVKLEAVIRQQRKDYCIK